MHDPNAQAAKLEEKGDVKAAFAGAAKTYHAEFRSDYGYHAQMEPLNAVVRISDAGDKAEVWEGSQAPDDIPQGGGEGARPQGRAGGFPPVLHGRRLRPALARRLRRRMRAHRQGGTPSGQADLDARGGHRARHVPPAVVPVPGGGNGRVRQGDRLEALRRRRRRIPAASPASRFRITGCRTSTSSGAASRTASSSSTGARWATCSTSSPSRASSTRWRSTRAWTRSNSASSAWAPRPRRASASRRVAQMSDWKAKRPDGRAIGISITERSGSLGAGVVEISLDRADRQDHACTRSGSRSTAASSCSRPRPRPTWRARSSTACPASCTSA